jgi:Flp pilus assembly CpaF family ATPase
LDGAWSDVLVSSELLVLVDAVHGDRHYRPSPFGSDAEVVEWVRWQAQRHGRAHRFDAAHPRINLRLPDGTRLHAVMGFTRRCHVALRPHPRSLDRLDALRAAGLMDRALHAFFTAAVAARVNIVVVGATGAGKTTFVRALLNEALAQAAERVVTIEEDEELFLTAGPTRDVVAMTAREPNVHGTGAITLEDCLREALRQRPDRIILGEARPGGREVLGILLAMSSGHPGSFSTVHADSSGEAFQRLALYAAMGGQTYTPEWFAQLISTAIDFVVHLGRARDGRRVVTSVREVTGVVDRTVLSSEVWAPDGDGRAVPHSPFTDRMVERLAAAGFDHQLRVRPDGWWDR